MSEEKLQSLVIPTVGHLLKKARKAQSLSLGAISKKLCISQRHLKSLEEDHENLVCDVYTLGFLKSYAQFLGLNEKDLTEQFKEQAIKPSSPQLPYPAPLPGKGLPTLPILSFSIFALIGIIAGWQWYGYSHSPISPPQEQKWTQASQPPPSASPVPVVVPKEPLTEELPHIIPVIQDVQPVELPVLEPQISLSPGAVILKVTEEAWVEVKDEEGNKIVSGIFKPGETYEFKNPKNLILKTGNAKGIQLISGEKILSFSENIGAVKSNIPLNPEKWVDQKQEPQ